MEREHIIHLLAGGTAGTVGAILTCPLEVVKTRLQSSIATFGPSFVTDVRVLSASAASQSSCGNIALNNVEHYSSGGKGRVSLGIILCLRHIFVTEGAKGLFKGLGPNLVGVAPSRAIYFFTYANTKQFLNERLNPDTACIHMSSAITAGFIASTLTNPIWFVKTRLQLDQKRESNLKCSDCVRQVYNRSGLLGFYKGISASYFGITETVIHFVIYEHLKEKLIEASHKNDKDGIDFLKCMVAAATSKSVATTIAYPHEVVRTRLREEGNKYKSFLQTFLLVFREEGASGLYRGLATQFVRQIPNSAIMMATYEFVVYLLSDDH
ncbi:solute carrier family 25 member 36 [Patella vulgata]|uniref:solute carrier family 25 member 36 n=1 Tax=Patella vulgata TaxID=6465 RepID=UPI00217FB5B1|nr:solute carrier family 25 member 36 [Patella vulgata]